ncbi:pilus assembly protein TadG-related protein [Methylocystis sp. JR02]|uniref:pilus assembly protein TadG-related protein n=1 Tax=Methylocystis sp. JR02 TaxID=3046284 RepID=UPI0024BA10ED|nr:pilus assembly protein TadG-related protein [Methylocystis sp. JR02]MDJ0447448.1 pilus assembly protein TadG-related protein [Methylocystis sp. JR02]
MTNAPGRRRFCSDAKGSVAIVMALAMLVVVGVAALAVDLGSFFYQKRRLQAATDLAAVAAAGNLAKAQDAAIATLALNGFAANALQSVETGAYVADASVPADKRFTVQPLASSNGVRLRTQITTPRIFSAIFAMMAPAAVAAISDSCTTASPCGAAGGSAPQQGVAISAQATAAQNALASFAIGSRLASLNGGVVNSVLGALLGTNLSLSLMDYQALASTSIDLFTFSNALATRASLTAVTYDQLAAGTFKAGDLLGAALDAAKANTAVGSTAIGALSQITAAAPNVTAPINQLLSYGPYGSMTVGSAAPISVSVSALDLVSAIAQIANGKHQIEAGLNLGLPGVASASLQLAIGERPVGTSWVAVGAAGASVHTAQTRLLLTLEITVPGLSTTVHAPLYVELASGTAQLSSVQCASGDPTSSSVTLGVTPAVVDAWIGNVSSTEFGNFTSAPNPGPATLLNLANIAKVTGLAHATVTNLQATPVSFSYSEILQATKKTTSTTDFISSLLYNLFGGLQLKVTALGLSLLVPAGLDQTVATTLASATTPIDQTLSQLLQTLGVGLGQADTWVGGVKCGAGVLVN